MELAAARLFLAVLLVAASVAARNEGRRRPWVVSAVVVGLALCTILLFTVVPLPPAHSADAVLARPQELVPGVLFAIAALVFWRSRRWRSDPFTYWMLVGLVVHVAAQVAYMPFSRRIFDLPFLVAHGLKIVGYGCVLVGIARARSRDRSEATAAERRAHQATRWLSMRSMLGTTVLVVGITAVTSIQLGRFDGARAHAEVINRAGRQRLLVQRAALLVHRLHDADPSEGQELTSRLDDTVAAIEETHRFLRSESSPTKASTRSEAIDAALLEIEPPMRELLAHCASLARSEGPPSASDVRRVHDDADELIERLEGLVDRYEAATGERISALERMTVAAMVSLLLIVVLQAVFVYWPMLRRNREDVGALYALNQSLEQRVAERTAELEQRSEGLERANAALGRHADELKRSNEALDQFAYVASHDLKSPLRDVDNLSQWLVEDLGESIPEASREHLSKLRGRVLRMERLLDDLLRFSRAGRVHGEVGDIVLTNLFDRVLGQIEVPAGFELILPKRTLTIHGPATPLEQVLRNLLTNAVKHHDRPEGRIVIGLEDEGELVTFTVTDDGPGIEPEFRERVFAMFQTLKSRDEVEGSGIGLALVRKLVEAYGGTVVVEDAEPRGVTFRFTWPRRWEPPSADPQAQA